MKGQGPDEDMKNIDADIRSGQLKHMYLLYGKEDYLKKQYEKRLISAFVPDGSEMNISRYEGADIVVRDVIDDAETMPFFADHKAVILEDSGFFKSAPADFAEYLPQASENTFFLFVESEVDKRSKSYKAVSKLGYAAEFGEQPESTLTRWIGRRMAAEGRKVRESDVKYMIARCGTDMNKLSMEMEKLFSYTSGRDMVTKEDIDAVCTVTISNHIFDMVDAVSDQNLQRALKLYYELLELKEAPMWILYLITRQFRLMIQIQSLHDAGKGNDTIAKLTGIPPYTVPKYLRGAGRFGMDRLREAMTDCTQMEEAVKTGHMTDQLSVEMLIIRYGSRKQER